MFDARQHRLKLLLAIAVLGLLGDIMLRAFPWGLNVSLWFALVLALHFAYCRAVNAPKVPGLRWALGAALFFAFLMAWRDAPGIKVLNIFVVMSSIVIAAALAARRDMRRVWITEYVDASWAALRTSLKVPGKAAPQFAESLRNREQAAGIPFVSILRGFLLTVPLFLVFGGLFYSADATFEALVFNLFDFDVLEGVKHALLAFACAWFAAAVVVLCLKGSHTPVEGKKPFFPFSVGAVEVNTALVLIDILFLTFVLIQFQYLFGDHERVQGAIDLTYSDYARRGFFELAAVASLALVLLLTCARLVEDGGPSAKRLFAALGCTLVVFVLVILSSSLHRMSMYVDAYGLTRLRLYTAVFSIWLGVVYLWLAVTILRARARDFAFGFLLSGYAAAFLLQCSNPDAIIVRVNIDRLHNGKSFDREYPESPDKKGIFGHAG